MKHFGDITKLHGDELPIVDIITGGSPCQDLSVAGRREGLDGERSSLFFEQIRIIKELRNADRRNGRPDDLLRPRYMVFENVEGVFSSNDGEDFRIILEETARVADSNTSIPRLPSGETWSHAGVVMGDGWSIAWRLHDAQFWGVPQRRRRVALVADFGGTTAPEILFEREGLSRDIEASGSQREGTSAAPTGSTREASYTLKIRGGSDTDQDGRTAGKGPLVQEELSGTLGVSQDQTLFSKVYGMSPLDSNAMKSDNPQSGIYEADTSRTLDNNGGNPSCNQGGMMVCYGLDRASFNQGEGALYDFAVEEEKAQPLVSRGAGGGNDRTKK